MSKEHQGEHLETQEESTVVAPCALINETQHNTYLIADQRDQSQSLLSTPVSTSKHSASN